MSIIDNELLDQLCECVQRNWPGRGIIPGQCWRWFDVGPLPTSTDCIFVLKSVAGVLALFLCNFTSLSRCHGPHGLLLLGAFMCTPLSLSRVSNHTVGMLH